MKAIEIKNLNKSYKKVRALTGLDLTVSQGTITGFVGSNGAGKSTTINILANTIKKDSGIVKILNDEIEAGDWKYKKHVGFALEKPKYLEYLNGREFLEFAGTMQKVPFDILSDRVDELLAVFELDEKKDKLIKTYSKGMRQKITLSSALLNNPQLLILDEPFEGLDPISRRKAKNILTKIKNSGKTVLISSHILIEIEDFCDEIAIINKGKIIYQSATKDIRNKIKNEVTKETYSSLEEIFLDITKSDLESDSDLSWI